MFYGVIVSHMLVVLFAACGISGLVAYFGEIDTAMGYPAFLKGLAEVSWPLAVAAVIYMLVQIACQVQQVALALRLQPGMPGTPGVQGGLGMQSASRVSRFADDGEGDDGQEAGEEGQAAAGGRSPFRGRAEASVAESAGRQSQKPVSFFDISDAVIPQASAAVPQPSDDGDSGGGDARQNPAGAAARSGGESRGGTEALPAETPSAPVSEPGAGKPEPQQEAEKTPHFFTLD